MKKILSLILSFILCIGLFPTQVDANSLSSGHYLVINCNTNKMGYYKDGILVREFSVATGKAGSETPRGKFTIVNKIVNRPFYSGGIAGGDPRNPLGDRWLGLHIGSTYGTTYGIHGNNNENSIGNSVSAGCVRMHNEEIRWLFDQIPVKSEAIIYNGTHSYSEEASKYGVRLASETPLNQKQINAINTFNEFEAYGPVNNPTINLSSTNGVISTLEIANNILSVGTTSNKSDRQNFFDAWGVLSDQEKKHEEVAGLYNSYERIIKVAEAAKGVNAFYEKMNSYGTSILNDPNKAISLNSVNNLELGSRGYAKKMYDDVVKLGENENNSARMKDLYIKYYDSVNFLNIATDLQNRDITSAREKVNNIQGANLRNIATNAINNYSDINGHWAYSNIKSAMNKNWVATTNHFRPNDAITRAEFVKIVNNAFGFKESQTISFKDVGRSDWYYGEVAIAVKNGYLGGYSDNTFKPNEELTREQVASIIAMLTNRYDSDFDKLNKYSDGYRVASWAQQAFEGVLDAGYLAGYSDNTLKPTNKITRAEALVIIERLVK